MLIKNIDNIVAKKPFSLHSYQFQNWIRALVVKGKKRGRRIGFPTINLKPLEPKNIMGKDFLRKIKKGVYFCHLKIKNQIYYGLLHYGPRLTFKEENPTFETYVLNFNQIVKPGIKIKFKLLKYLRKTQKFKCQADLARQIKKDIKSVLRYNRIKKFFKIKNDS